MKIIQKQYITKSALETKKLAESLAEKILKSKPKNKAIVLALEGDLGGGKTTFIQGLAKGLGVKAKILSPTFVIMRKFQIQNQNVKCQIKPKAQNPKLKYFYHIDCYRIEKPKELLDIGFKKIVSNPQNIVVIEWSDRVRKIIPKTAINLKFDFIDNKTRKITIKI